MSAGPSFVGWGTDSLWPERARHVTLGACRRCPDGTSVNMRNIGDPVHDAESVFHEQRLVSRVRDGDQDAFEEIFRRFAPQLADFIYRHIRSREEAQDIVQDIFLKLWRGRANFFVRNKLADYLYTAARNGIRDRFTHQRVVRSWQKRTRDEQEVAADATALEMLESAERHAAIMRALAELPERRRIVCTLRWVNGLSYAEIAQRLGITEKTVNNQLDRGFRELRHRFSVLRSVQSGDWP